jgi:hypothetical protein
MRRRRERERESRKFGERMRGVRAFDLTKTKIDV